MALRCPYQLQPDNRAVKHTQVCMFKLGSQGYPHHAESQVPFPSMNITLSPAKPEHTNAGKTSNQIVLSGNGFSLLPGRRHVPRSAVIARATIFIQGNQGKMSFTSGVISTSVWTHQCKGSSPAQAEEYHLGTALKDTSNRSTIILHVSILKPSDLISLPVKKEQETGLSLHTVP